MTIIPSKLHVLEIRVQFLGIGLSITGPDISGRCVEARENIFLIDNGIDFLLVVLHTAYTVIRRARQVQTVF